MTGQVDGVIVYNYPAHSIRLLHALDRVHLHRIPWLVVAHYLLFSTQWKHQIFTRPFSFDILLWFQVGSLSDHFPKVIQPANFEPLQ